MKRTWTIVLLLAMVISMLGGMAMGETANAEKYAFRVMSNIAPEITKADQMVFDAIAADLNLELDVQPSPSSSYAETLQLMLASGDYPELVLFPNHTDKMYVDAVADGIILDVAPYLENYENLMAYSYPISWETLKIQGDDAIYGIPRTSIARQDGYMIRKDWLDNLGITYDETKPVTLEWLTDVAYKFTFNDPDGNGQNDTYAFSLYSTDGALSPQMGLAFGVSGWREYDGEYMDLMYSKTNDAYKRALAWTAEQYKLGTIDPDWPSLSLDASYDRFLQGITGIRGEFAGWMSEKQDLCRKVNPEAELGYITFVVEEEGQPAIGGSFSIGFWGEWAVMKSAEKPERVLEFLDALLSDKYWTSVMYGPEGVRWTRNAQGNPVATAEFLDNPYLAPRNILRRNNAPAFFVALNLSEENRARVENLIDICIKQAVFPLDQGHRPEIANDPAFIDYQAKMRVEVSKIIVGEQPVDNWDNILEGWYQAGGEQYVADMQAYIAQQQAK